MSLKLLLVSCECECTSYAYVFRAKSTPFVFFFNTNKKDWIYNAVEVANNKSIPTSTHPSSSSGHQSIISATQILSIMIRYALSYICLPSLLLLQHTQGFSSTIVHRPSFTTSSISSDARSVSASISTSTSTSLFYQPTELPDSLDDAAILAANACSQYASDAGSMARCRVDFDTSVGDETYTTLKSSTEFMQKFVTAVCYEMIPGVKEMREKEIMALVSAKAEMAQLGMVEVDDEDDEGEDGGEENENEVDNNENDDSDDATMERKKELVQIIQCGGRTPKVDDKGNFLPYDGYTGPKVRIYFPDEGSAALARRDWNPTSPNAETALVPPCVEFSSCGGVQMQDISQDAIVFFFCPKASEAEFVEEALLKSESTLEDQLKLTIFVNPLLVDMGVTGFGLAGRMLRERLIDNLMPTYYLRTLAWGALTRIYPNQFTVWQEDENSDDGYRMIKSMDRLPSNPEVEDIYDIENGIANDPEKQQGFGLLNAIGDFVNGMTKL